MSAPSLAELIQKVHEALIPALESTQVDRFVGERIASDEDEQIHYATEAEVRVYLKTGASLPLNPHCEIANHSPTGVNWGYAGSGPSQLALAILAETTGSPFLAEYFHQEFKRTVIAGITSSRLEVTARQVIDWLNPRLDKMLRYQLEFLFDAAGNPDPMPSIRTVHRGPDFSFEWNADGTIDRIDLSDGSPDRPQTPRERIHDIPQFYIEEVLQAKPEQT